MIQRAVRKKKEAYSAALSLLQSHGVALAERNSLEITNLSPIQKVCVCFKEMPCTDKSETARTSHDVTQNILILQWFLQMMVMNGVLILMQIPMDLLRSDDKDGTEDLHMLVDEKNHPIVLCESTFLPQQKRCLIIDGMAVLYLISDKEKVKTVVDLPMLFSSRTEFRMPNCDWIRMVFDQYCKASRKMTAREKRRKRCRHNILCCQ